MSSSPLTATTANPSRRPDEIRIPSTYTPRHRRKTADDCLIVCSFWPVGDCACMIDVPRGSRLGNLSVVQRRGGATVSVGGRTAAHADLGHPAAGSESLGHLAYFYDEERDYLSYLSAFVTAGLRNAEPVFVAVPGRNAGLLRERLGAESHLLRYGAMAETGRNPARLIPELRAFIDEHPGRRIRYVSEALWPRRTDAELCEAARHEALVNLAFASAAVTIVRPYDVSGLAPAAVGAAHPPHPAFLRKGRAHSAAHRTLP